MQTETEKAIDIDYRVGRNTQLGPKTEKKIVEIGRAFAARLTDSPTPQDGDSVILRGHNTSGPVVYHRGHLEGKSYMCGEGELSYCTQPMEPHIHMGDACGPAKLPRLHTQASGGYWGTAKISDLRHVGTIKKWFWIWGEYGPGADCGVHICMTVNQWEYTNTEKIY